MKSLFFLMAFLLAAGLSGCRSTGNDDNVGVPQLVWIDCQTKKVYPMGAGNEMPPGSLSPGFAVSGESAAALSGELLSADAGQE